jgi:hypothetical protein
MAVVEVERCRTPFRFFSKTSTTGGVIAILHLTPRRVPDKESAWKSREAVSHVSQMRETSLIKKSHDISYDSSVCLSKIHLFAMIARHVNPETGIHDQKVGI